MAASTSTPTCPWTTRPARRALPAVSYRYVRVVKRCDERRYRIRRRKQRILRQVNKDVAIIEQVARPLARA